MFLQPLFTGIVQLFGFAIQGDSRGAEASQLLFKTVVLLADNPTHPTSALVPLFLVPYSLYP